MPPPLTVRIGAPSTFSEHHQREPVPAGGPALPDANLHRRRSAGMRAGD